MPITGNQAFLAEVKLPHCLATLFTKISFRQILNPQETIFISFLFVCLCLCGWKILLFKKKPFRFKVWYYFGRINSWGFLFFFPSVAIEIPKNYTHLAEHSCNLTFPMVAYQYHQSSPGGNILTELVKEFIANSVLDLW